MKILFIDENLPTIIDDNVLYKNAFSIILVGMIIDGESTIDSDLY